MAYKKYHPDLLGHLTIPASHRYFRVQVHEDQTASITDLRDPALTTYQTEKTISTIHFLDYRMDTAAHHIITQFDTYYIDPLNTAPFTLEAKWLLENDHDIHNHPLTVYKVGNACGGTVELDKKGEVIFAPDWPSDDELLSFDYYVKNNHGHKHIAPTRVYLVPEDMPHDPYLPKQWYVWDLRIPTLWREGYKGQGVRISTVDILSPEHPDLTPAHQESYEPTSPYFMMTVPHGLMVGGIMSATHNELGIAGIAPNATLTQYHLPLDKPDAIYWTDLLLEQDIVNNSWGFGDNTALTLSGQNKQEIAENILKHFEKATIEGRDTKGTIIIFAAGNHVRDNIQFDLIANNAYTISTGGVPKSFDQAVDTNIGELFTTHGSGILLSAPVSDIPTLTVAELRYDKGSLHGFPIVELNKGTSFSAPIVSGVVALMLEANPALGWRDVQWILASTATRVDISPTLAKESIIKRYPAEYKGELSSFIDYCQWSDNGSHYVNMKGLHYHPWFGFGQVDALAAVRLAEIWPLHLDSHHHYQTSSDALLQHGVLPASLPRGMKQQFTFLVDESTWVEEVEITIALHMVAPTLKGLPLTITLPQEPPTIRSLTVTLTSPSGTASKLMHYPITPVDHLEWTFHVRHYLGEDSVGQWSVEVEHALHDKVQQAALADQWSFAAMIHDVDLRFRGAELPFLPLIFTEEFKGIMVDSPSSVKKAGKPMPSIMVNAVPSIEGLNPGLLIKPMVNEEPAPPQPKWIKDMTPVLSVKPYALLITAPITTPVTISLHPEHPSVINGVTVALTEVDHIQRIILGDGDDVVHSSPHGTHLYCLGRGNDTLYLYGADDALDYTNTRIPHGVDTVYGFAAGSTILHLPETVTPEMIEAALTEEGNDTHLSLVHVHVILKDVSKTEISPDSFVLGGVGVTHDFWGE